MDPAKAPESFPKSTAKLSQPIMQSQFEKQKATKEAKRKRDEADAKAALEKFVEDFGGHEDPDDADSGFKPNQGDTMTRPPRGDPDISSGFNSDRRHFASSGMKKSGPGTLGSNMKLFGSKTSHKDKDNSGDSKDKYESAPRKDMRTGTMSVSEALRDGSDDEMQDFERAAAERAEMRAAAKPQLRLSNLPPDVPPAGIRAILPDDLSVVIVKIDPPPPPDDMSRRCTNAVVTLSRETTGKAIENAVSTLNNRYVGFGFYLSVCRHFSSAVTNPATTPSLSTSSTQFFGAIPMENPKPTFRKVGQHRGYAPPSSYSNTGSNVARPDQFYVPVTPPDDIRTIRQIHMVVENILKHGEEYEAVLMSRPEVQYQEEWAWIWDARSVGGVWYRWRLWELKTEYKADPDKEPYVYLFEDSPPWKVPDPLPFEFLTDFDKIVSDEDYNSEDEDEVEAVGNSADAERKFLGPLGKAKLVHLLARLPTTLSKLRKGDIARVTAHVLSHADRGPRESVDLLVRNMGMPLTFTSANLNRDDGSKELRQGLGTEEPPSNEVDTSASSLIGLYVVSDILSASSSARFRHAWKFRGLFDKAMKEYEIFDFLGKMPIKHGWGRMRAENWKRSINLVLHLWEGWCVFPNKTMDTFKASFESPPSLKLEAKHDNEVSDKGKWKPMDTKTATQTDEPMDVEMTGVDTNPVTIDKDDIKGEVMDEDDAMGQVVHEDDAMGQVMDEDDVMGQDMDGDDAMGEVMDENDVLGEAIGEGEVLGEPMTEKDVEGKSGLRKSKQPRNAFFDETVSRWKRFARE